MLVGWMTLKKILLPCKVSMLSWWLCVTHSVGWGTGLTLSGRSPCPLLGCLTVGDLHCRSVCFQSPAVWPLHH